MLSKFCATNVHLRQYCFHFCIEQHGTCEQASLRVGSGGPLLPNTAPGTAVLAGFQRILFCGT